MAKRQRSYATTRPIVKYQKRKSYQPRFQMGRKLMPDFFYSTLKYAEQFPFTTVSGSISSHVFRGNGPFDPDHSGIGHQPYGFDQIAALYRQVHVVGSSIQVDAVSNSSAYSASNTDFSIAVSPLSTDWSGVAPDSAREGPVSVYGILTRDKPLKLYLARTAKQALVNIDEANSSSAITTIPITQWFYTVSHQASDRATTLDIIVKVLITYRCKFYTRVQPGTS